MLRSPWRQIWKNNSTIYNCLLFHWNNISIILWNTFTFHTIAIVNNINENWDLKSKKKFGSLTNWERIISSPYTGSAVHMHAANNNTITWRFNILLQQNNFPSNLRWISQQSMMQQKLYHLMLQTKRFNRWSNASECQTLVPQTSCPHHFIYGVWMWWSTDFRKSTKTIDRFPFIDLWNYRRCSLSNLDTKSNAGEFF